MLKTLLILGIIFAGTCAMVIGGAFAVGSRMPSQIEVTRTISINRPPENVWWVLTDYNSFPLWHPQYRSAGIVSPLGEKPIRWRATYTDGRTANMIVAEENAPNHYAERISDTNLPFSGSWTLDLERRELTTEVTVHSHAELHRPLDRLLVHLFVTPELEVEKILNGLKRRVEASTVKPTAATS
jgi:uncharacterized protein YndB with AHSA1/START domain